MSGLIRNLGELKLPIKLDKQTVKLTPRRFAPKVMSKIKAKIERFLKKKL